MNEILVIGGSNIDYLAKSKNTLIMEDSNIGVLTTSFGGVGRNITENLARLHDQVTFLTGIGEDVQGQKLKADLESLYVKVLCPAIAYPSGSYVSIADESGNMKVAICDSRLMDNMTIGDLEPFFQVIDSHENIVLEANLNETVIDAIFDRFKGHRFYIEGVSANKIRRFRNHVSEIYLFKSNLMEARYFLSSDLDGQKAAKDLMELGAKNVVLSQGKDPIIYGTAGHVFTQSVVACPNVASVNGAGDALFSGIVHGMIHCQSLKESVEFGSKMSLMTLQAESAVNPDIGRILK
ncbi:MAG: PfkB family carbohydrate kinase [Bacilli bacterium]